MTNEKIAKLVELASYQADLIAKGLDAAAAVKLETRKDNLTPGVPGYSLSDDLAAVTKAVTEAFALTTEAVLHLATERKADQPPEFQE
ncbi:MAG: hypothetical protein CMB99_16310 [Flavobacteriaceae bacterium]|nr:hypothetical protein [Flavobacteriaceae bacterium]|tara:strand:- start:4834 stop:5097 length:264 start_codon:yes stop_codon:yes gene_type:complete